MSAEFNIRQEFVKSVDAPDIRGGQNFAAFSTANASIWGKVSITLARFRAAGDNPSSLSFQW